MNKITSFLLILVLLISLTGCTLPAPPSVKTDISSQTESHPTDSDFVSLPEEYLDPSVVSTWYADCEEQLNLYISPDSDSQYISQIPAGAEFRLLGWSGEFAFVDYDGLRGYVASGYIQPIGRLAANTIPWEPICEKYISLRSEPGGTTVLAKMPAGSSVTFEKWHGKYAFISYQGIKGYVLANCIMPQSDTYFSDCLEVLLPTAQYSYTQMMEDISQLVSLYPDKVTQSVIGKSELGQEIPVVILGNPDAEHHVLIQAAIHGREHLTAWLSMAIADYSLSEHYFDFKKVCYHIIPMANPDGVAISQSGELDSLQKSIYKKDKAYKYTNLKRAAYAKNWKANATGTDLNRNFPSGWENITKRKSPSSEQYRGPSPFSAAESIALRDYTLKHSFDVTISLHSSGSMIYYRYGGKEELNLLSQSLAKHIENTTGFPPEETDGTDGAGYKDWVMNELEIPSVTIEIGCTVSPLPEKELYNVFARCKEIVPTINSWIFRQP